MKNVKITVAGLGYVGLAAAVLLSQKAEVCAVDVLHSKVQLVNQRCSPIADPLIAHFLQEKALNLSATTNAEKGYANADFVVVAVPTDFDPESGDFDTSHVESVIEAASRYAPRAVVVIKSTVPIGYTKRMQERYPELCLLFCPEFLREGQALYDNLYPSRIIVGYAENHPAAKMQAEAFAQILKHCAQKGDVPVAIMGSAEAEAVKLFSNAYLALRVAFFNELDSFALAKGLNTKDIIDGVCLDPRISDVYNNPSFGYGGYCLPKDAKQLLKNFENIPETIMSAIVASNQTRKAFIAERIGAQNPKRIGIYRLTMKSGSENFRSSCVLDVMEMLRRQGRPIVIYEPAWNGDHFSGYPVLHNLEQFKSESDLILANRMSDELRDVQEKVFTRDIYFRD